MAAVEKQLKVKVGVIRRTEKEHTSYEKEISTQTNKIEKMRQEEKDFHDIKQQEEVLKEAQACLGDAKRRLDNAVQDLEEFIKAEGENLKEAADMEEAKSMLDKYGEKDI